MAAQRAQMDARVRVASQIFLLMLRSTAWGRSRVRAEARSLLREAICTRRTNLYSFDCGRQAIALQAVPVELSLLERTHNDLGDASSVGFPHDGPGTLPAHARDRPEQGAHDVIHRVHIVVVQQYTIRREEVGPVPHLASRLAFCAPLCSRDKASHSRVPRAHDWNAPGNASGIPGGRLPAGGDVSRLCLGVPSRGPVSW
jgi:hypothetical protein